MAPVESMSKTQASLPEVVMVSLGFISTWLIYLRAALYINMPDMFSVRRSGGLVVKEEDLDAYLALMHRAFRELVRGPDAVLAHYGLGRAHHRALFMIRREGDVSVGDLAAALTVTNQALHKTLQPLLHQGLVLTRTDPVDARRRRLCLSADGLLLEEEISGMQRAVFARVRQEVGEACMADWCRVMAVMEKAAKELPGDS
jgi:DNA-binding MarR family transcriptional regulator